MKIIIILILFLAGGFIIYQKSLKEEKIATPPRKIECPSGTAGEYCQYSDIDNCNGRGKVIVDFQGKPICKCFQNFDGANCESCKTGYGGTNCEYSDVEICNGRGTVKTNNDKNPVCIDCKFPFEGRYCDKCRPGYGGKDCNVDTYFCSDDNGVVRGKITTDQLGDPQCKCYSGYFGKKFNLNVGKKIKSCHLTTSDKCNYRGNYDPQLGICSTCMDGYFGDFCEIDEKQECGIGGSISNIEYNYDKSQVTVSCSCLGQEINPSISFITTPPSSSSSSSNQTTKIIKGFAGSKCQFNSQNICKGKGDLKLITTRDSTGKIVNEEATCTNCIGNLTGDYCNECKPGYYGKEFDCKFSNSYCNEGGRLSAESESNFSCICNPGSVAVGQDINRPGKRSGKRCQILDSELCNNRGVITQILDETRNPPLVKCSCGEDKYTGDNCEKCKDGFKGTNCQFSDQTTCNGRGTVNDLGVCTCFPSYTGDKCEICKPTDNNGKDITSIVYNNKLYCISRDYCNNNGVPESILSTGKVKCTCFSGFSGDQCQNS